MNHIRKKLDEIKKQKESGVSSITVLQNKMQEEMKKKYQPEDEEDLNDFIEEDIEQVEEDFTHKPRKINTGKAKILNTKPETKIKEPEAQAKIDKESMDIMSSLLQKKKTTSKTKPDIDLDKIGSLQNQFNSGFDKDMHASRRHPSSTESSSNDITVVSYNKQHINHIRSKLGKLQKVPFFIADIVESTIDKSILYLIGKIQHEGKYYSTCVKVEDMQRELYVFPRYGYTAQQVEEEITQLQSKSHYKNKLELSRVTKKYCFELNIDTRNEATEIVKINQSFKQGVPSWLKQCGETYKGVVGSSYTPTELFIMQKSIQGPMWVDINHIDFNIQQPFAREYINAKIHNYNRDIEVNNTEKNMPTFVTSTFEVEINNETKEIAAMLMVVYNNYNIDTTEYTSADFILWKQRSCVSEAYKPHYQKQTNTKYHLYEFDNEYTMLNHFQALYTTLNVDIIMGHDLLTSSLNVLVDKLSTRGKAVLNTFSIFTDESTSKQNRMAFGSGKLRSIFVGKLLVDTYSLSRETIKMHSYTLSSIMEHFFGHRVESEDKMLRLVDNSTNVVKIAGKLQILPLTLQLSRVAGCLWHLSLEQARSRRNEILLMHNFYKNNYVVPDKPKYDNDKQKDDKKDKYLGGKVLEPKAGFYDNYVVLVDFNSLYPSIIRQYKICFTTVLREFKEPEADNIPKDASVIDENAEDGDIIDPNSQILLPKDSEPLLPEILTYLINKRKAVKSELKKAKTELQRSQLDTKQQAYKLIANSIYGCLGFPFSRFYAKKMAMLVTCFGRMLLDSSIKKVEMLGYDVIYGDTDSIMVNTKQAKVEEAIIEGINIKKEINKQFHKAHNNQQILEVELDGVYKKLLLLKKKKYAGLLIVNFNEILLSKKDVKEQTKMEVKGLDLVRRDWSKLTKEVSERVLDILMTTGDVSDVIDFLYVVNQKLDDYARGSESKVEGSPKSTDYKFEISLSHFILKKQLNKKPDDYPKNTNLPHVKVANDMKRLFGKKDEQLVNHFIPYVMVKEDEKSGNKAMHPSEFMELKDKVSIDVSWYKTNQLSNPIQRILEPIEGFSNELLKSTFNITISRELVAKNEIEIFVGQIYEAARDKIPLIYSHVSFDLEDYKIKCNVCKGRCWGFAFNCTGKAIANEEELKFTVAEFSNRVTQVLKRLSYIYGMPVQRCGKCGFSTKLLSGTSCCPECAERLDSESKADDYIGKLVFFRHIAEKYILEKENYENRAYIAALDQIDFYIKTNAYESANCAALFRLYIKQYADMLNIKIIDSFNMNRKKKLGN